MQRQTSWWGREGGKGGTRNCKEARWRGRNRKREESREKEKRDKKEEAGEEEEGQLGKQKRQDAIMNPVVFSFSVLYRLFVVPSPSLLLLHWDAMIGYRESSRRTTTKAECAQLGEAGQRRK